MPARASELLLAPFDGLFGRGRGTDDLSARLPTGRSAPARDGLPALAGTRTRVQYPFRTAARRQKLGTGVIDFDAQTTSLRTGAFRGGTCLSAPFRATEDGPRASFGAGRDADLNGFPAVVPDDVRAFAVACAGYGPGYLACLFHHDRSAGERHVHAFLVIDARDDRLLGCFYGTTHPQSERIVAVCAPYLAVAP